MSAYSEDSKHTSGPVLVTTHISCRAFSSTLCVTVRGHSTGSSSSLVIGQSKLRYRNLAEIFGLSRTRGLAIRDLP